MSPWLGPSTYRLHLTPQFCTTRVYGTIPNAQLRQNLSHFLPLRLLWQSITSVLTTILEESAFVFTGIAPARASSQQLLATNHSSRLYRPQGLNFPVEYMHLFKQSCSPFDRRFSTCTTSNQQHRRDWWVYDSLLWRGTSPSPRNFIKERKLEMIYINIISNFFIKIKLGSERGDSNIFEKAW